MNQPPQRNQTLGGGGGGGGGSKTHHSQVIIDGESIHGYDFDRLCSYNSGTLFD